MIYTQVPNRPAIALPAHYESFAWYYPNCEMQTKDWFVRHAEADWSYFDCGANIGYYSILFAQLSPAGHIHSFEPTSTAEMLATNLVHHSIDNVTVHRLALGKTERRARDKIYRIWGQEPEETELAFTTVDVMTTRLDLQRLDCIKIDVDSYDFEVLQGAEETLARFDPWVVIELNHALSMRGQSVTAAMAWLSEHGYRHSLILDQDNFVLRKSWTGIDPVTSHKLSLYFP